MGESPVRGRLDVSVIEAELQTLWRQIARETKKEDGEVLRASVVNLVVCSDLDEEVEQLASDLTAAGGGQPGRLILLLTDEDSPEDGFDARVSAQCQVQPGGREQICGEIIRIVVHGDAADRSASVVAPLLVPDLPGFLWWRRSMDVDSPLLRRLAAITDRLVVDSARRGVDDLRALAKFMTDARDVTISDLAWARLQEWRRALAGLYDSGLTREVLTRPTSIRLEFGASEHLPNEALYVLSWLASRLNWELPSRLVETEAGYRLEGRASHADLTIDLHPAPGRGRGICGMELSCAGDLIVHLVRHDSEEPFLETRVEWRGRRLNHQILPLTSQREMDLLAAELEIPWQDRVFEQALTFASRLA